MQVKLARLRSSIYRICLWYVTFWSKNRNSETIVLALKPRSYKFGKLQISRRLESLESVTFTEFNCYQSKVKTYKSHKVLRSSLRIINFTVNFGTLYSTTSRLQASLILLSNGLWEIFTTNFADYDTYANLYPSIPMLSFSYRNTWAFFESSSGAANAHITKAPNTIKDFILILCNCDNEHSFQYYTESVFDQINWDRLKLFIATSTVAHGIVRFIFTFFLCDECVYTYHSYRWNRNR